MNSLFHAHYLVELNLFYVSCYISRVISVITEIEELKDYGLTTEMIRNIEKKRG